MHKGCRSGQSDLFLDLDRDGLAISRQHLTVGHWRIHMLSMPEVLDVDPRRRNHCDPDARRLTNQNKYKGDVSVY
jgi:hypothetical protein